MAIPKSSQIDVPITDIVSYSFDNQTQGNDEKPLSIDAEDPSKSLNAAQIKQLVRRLIAGLRAAGLKRGDSVVLPLPNSYVYIALFLGIIGAGGVFCGTNSSFHVDELDHVVHQADARFVITTQDILPRVVAIAHRRGLSEHNIFVLDGIIFPLKHGPYPSNNATGDVWTQSRGVRKVSELLLHGEEDWIRLRDKKEMEDTLAVYHSTSGTTGLSKLAMLSHYSLISQQVILHEDVSHQVVRLCCLPMFHLFGALWSLYATVRYRQPVYVMDRFNIDAFARNVSKYAITETFMVPPMVHALNRSSLPLRDIFTTMRYIVVSAAPIDRLALDDFGTHLQPNCTMTQALGMTEVGVTAIFRYNEKLDRSSVGSLLPGCEMQLVDREGCVIEADEEPGELMVRTPGLFGGYRNLAASESKGGWLRTGDIVKVKDGKLYIVGREKELIKVRGWQVAPTELETLIMQHPGVADCAVAGINSADGTTELPRAYVVRQTCLDAGSPISSEEVYDLVKNRLVGYKRLDGGVVFVSSIPRTATGKIQRFKLLQMAPQAEMTEPTMKTNMIPAVHTLVQL